MRVWAEVCCVLQRIWDRLGLDRVKELARVKVGDFVAWANITRYVIKLAKREPDQAEQDVQLVERARLEWIAAKSYFNSVVEPELVDHAIFLMEAAQRRYCYLLKKARRDGISLSPLKRIISRHMPSASA